MFGALGTAVHDSALRMCFQDRMINIPGWALSSEGQISCSADASMHRRVWRVFRTGVLPPPHSEVRTLGMLLDNVRQCALDLA